MVSKWGKLLKEAYHIYAFDWMLLAEYDGYGVCLREYIYIGEKMVAEYQPQTCKYYYYTIDQIGSTRIVTDDAGNIVYAAAHDPNCDINIRENCWFIRMLALSS